MTYDEFGLFAENAEELGLPLTAPLVRRDSVTVDAATGQHVSALVWGDAAANDTELVLIHGGAQNAHTWDSVALCLDRPLVAIDLPGHGHSDHRGDHAYWPHENAAAIATALRSLAPTPKLVVGMSLGGLSSIALASLAPELVANLLLVDVTPGVDEAKSSAIHQFIDGPEYFESFDEILQRTIVFNPTRSEQSLRRGVMHNAIEDADGRWRWRYDLPRRGTGGGDGGQLLPGLAALWDAIGASKMPLTLARGSTSPVVSDDDVAELLRRRPDATVVVFEGAGHSIQGDQPAALADHIASMLG
jgi:pimeloyl-ACP methyl ester carboxylesterase